jgi:hypothetical protein
MEVLSKERHFRNVKYSSFSIVLEVNVDTGNYIYQHVFLIMDFSWKFRHLVFMVIAAD